MYGSARIQSTLVNSKRFGFLMFVPDSNVNFLCGNLCIIPRMGEAGVALGQCLVVILSGALFDT